MRLGRKNLAGTFWNMFRNGRSKFSVSGCGIRQKGNSMIGLDREPWVWIPNGKWLKNWGTEDEIKYNQRIRHAEKYRFYQFAFDYLKENGILGDYLEFGCHRARTFRMALTEARRQNMDKMHFHAFDSFEIGRAHV